MRNSVEVKDANGVSVGKITFDEAPRQLSAQRTAAGFELQLPMTVQLKLNSTLDPCPMLSNISAVITAVNDAGKEVTLTRVRHYGWLIGAVKESSTPAVMIWSDSLLALIAYERFRDGRRPRFKIALNAELCKLVPPSLVGGPRRRTEPFTVQGTADVSYPSDVWVKLVRDLAISYPVLIEVPLPSSPPSPWDGVWRAIGEATTAFERGGETGWKGCISAVRLALDRWREVEAEDMGPSDLKKRTTKQRLDNIRWHLREYTHLAPHSGAEEFTRDDALLMLSTLSALLGVRKP
jgi:hypothetical protein